MNELIVAVVPIRSFRKGKSRLASILSEPERAELLRDSGTRVVRAALDSRVVDTVLVVSPEVEALEWAASFGPRVQTLAQDVDRPGLNQALGFARSWALERDVDRMLSLFADLPMLESREVRRLVARQQQIVLGPDRRQEGTNSLLLDLRGRGSQFRFAFGAGSLQKHLAEAGRLGLNASIVRLPGVEFDLDVPSDWHEYQERNGPLATNSQRFSPITLRAAME